jgi:hypothetical protein
MARKGKRVGRRRRGIYFDYDGDCRFRDEKWSPFWKQYWKRWLRRVRKAAASKAMEDPDIPDVPKPTKG